MADYTITIPDWGSSASKDVGHILATPEWVSSFSKDVHHILATPEWVSSFSKNEHHILATPEWVSRLRDVSATFNWISSPEGLVYTLATPEWVCSDWNDNLVNSIRESSDWSYDIATLKYVNFLLNKQVANGLVNSLPNEQIAKCLDNVHMIYNYKLNIIKSNTHTVNEHMLYASGNVHTINEYVLNFNEIKCLSNSHIVYEILSDIIGFLIEMVKFLIQLYTKTVQNLTNHFAIYYHTITSMINKCLWIKLKLAQNIIRKHDFNAFIRSIRSGTVISNGVSIFIIFIFIYFHDWQQLQHQILAIKKILIKKRIIRNMKLLTFKILLIFFYFQTCANVLYQRCSCDSFTSDDSQLSLCAKTNKLYLGGGKLNEFSYEELKPYVLSNSSFGNDLKFKFVSYVLINNF